jgi:hypothetical protein
MKRKAESLELDASCKRLNVEVAAMPQAILEDGKVDFYRRNGDEESKNEEDGEEEYKANDFYAGYREAENEVEVRDFALNASLGNVTVKLYRQKGGEDAAFEHWMQTIHVSHHFRSLTFW